LYAASNSVYLDRKVLRYRQLFIALTLWPISNNYTLKQISKIQKIVFILFLLFLKNVIIAQDIDSLQQIDSTDLEVTSSSDKQIGLTLSAKYYNILTSELSLVYGTYDYIGYMPFSTGFGIGSEFVHSQDLTFGPKISGWYQLFLLELNGNLIYYFNKMGYSSIKFRPEIGFGFHHFSLTYGINLNIWRKGSEIIDFQQFSIKFNFRLKRLKYKEYYNNGKVVEYEH
jgi:hypothetical protein